MVLLVSFKVVHGLKSAELLTDEVRYWRGEKGLHQEGDVADPREDYKALVLTYGRQDSPGDVVLVEHLERPREACPVEHSSVDEEGTDAGSLDICTDFFEFKS